jgi:hypothetical protein
VANINRADVPILPKHNAAGALAMPTVLVDVVGFVGTKNVYLRNGVKRIAVAIEHRFKGIVTDDRLRGLLLNPDPCAKVSIGVKERGSLAAEPSLSICTC